ncbi:hypothetical protein TNCV_5053551 [Trichonephila clavipes]|nr:hypothetical protein TNCV_5053551 [Trichonephila clavipes]
MRDCTRNLILPRAPKPNRDSMDLLHATLPCDMDAVGFLHSENPSIRVGVELETFCVKDQCQFNYATKSCSQLASLDKNNALREIKLRLSYLQGKSTTMSVIAHQTEKEWISANEKSRQRMSQTQAEGAAKQHAARLEEAYLRAHHSCFTT